jgi:hypothetical protein
MRRHALTPADRRTLQILAERAGRFDLAAKMIPVIPSRVKTANRRRRENRRERQRREMAELRAKVFARANGRGELCGQPLSPATGCLCHLNGGRGRRREHQSPENCVAEHPGCHRALDTAPLEWLIPVQAWALRHGYPMPERFRQLAALRGREIEA